MTKDEAMEMALEWIEAQPEPRMIGALERIKALRTALEHPEKIECSRSHPHENMGSHCQLRTEIARLTNENARLKAQPDPEPVAWVDPQTMYHLKIGLEGVHLVYETEMVNFLPLYDKPKGWRDNVAQAYLKGFDEGCKSVSARNGTTTGRSSGRVENIGCLGMPVNIPVTPPRKPLSDDELLAALKSVDSETARLPNGFKLFARAIEAAHGIRKEK